MEKLVTFSIAAYNAEKHLSHCLDSFTAARAVISQIEILVINDGSTDGTVHIAETYCKQFPESIFLVNKKNAGHGSTINEAIKRARGVYFKPIDADDTIISENLEPILQTLQAQSADMVITPFIEHIVGDKTRDLLVDYPFLPQEEAFTFSEVSWQYTIPFHALFYKTDILKDNAIHLTEHIFYEDTEFSLLPLPYLSTLYYIPRPLYCYNKGLSEQSTSLAHVIAHFDDLQTILCSVFEFYNTHQHDAERREYYKVRAHNVLNFFFKITLSPEWYKRADLQKRKRDLFKRLEHINRPLFLSFMRASPLKRMQYVCNYHLDGLFISIKNVLKGTSKKQEVQKHPLVEN